jgi:hypothetical protein
MASDLSTFNMAAQAYNKKEKWRQIFQVSIWQCGPELRRKKWSQIFQISLWQRGHKIRFPAFQKGFCTFVGIFFDLLVYYLL